MKIQDCSFNQRIPIRNYFIQLFSNASVLQVNEYLLRNDWSFSLPSSVSCVFYIGWKLAWGKPKIIFQFVCANLTLQLNGMDPAVYLLMLYSAGSYGLRFPFCLFTGRIEWWLFASFISGNQD